MPEIKLRPRRPIKPKPAPAPAPNQGDPSGITIVFMTGRAEPRLEWILAGIAEQQHASDRIELIIVDGYRHAPRSLDELAYAGVAMPSSIYRTSIVSPKPNIWQGAHRVTSRDWWATANARNTAIALARHDYLAFLDDRSRLGPSWLETVRRGRRERASVIVGAYEKLETVELDGKPSAQTKITRDHRWGLYPKGRPDCGGGWLFGCTFALPLAWLLECNGLEEGCDGLTGEDYILGLMLGNNGHRIDYVPDLFVSQDRTARTEHGFVMTDKGKAPNDKSHAALARFGKAKRTEYTPDLSALREALALGEGFPIPDPGVDYRDWYDGQPIREMAPPT